MTMVTSRRERKKEATRHQIVKVAVDLFSKHGIEAVTVDQIAETADVGKGTIYNYFHTKEDIVVAFMAEFEQKVQAKLHHFDPSDRPVPEVLTEFVRTQFRMKEPYHR